MPVPGVAGERVLDVGSYPVARPVDGRDLDAIDQVVEWHEVVSQDFMLDRDGNVFVAHRLIGVALGNVAQAAT